MIHRNEKRKSKPVRPMQIIANHVSSLIKTPPSEDVFLT